GAAARGGPGGRPRAHGRQPARDAGRHPEPRRPRRGTRHGGPGRRARAHGPGAGAADVAVTTPRVLRLATLPTPLTEAPRLAAALGLAGRLLVKRDDLTGFAVAGNKARALEPLLADAVAQRATVLVTGGAPT